MQNLCSVGEQLECTPSNSPTLTFERLLHGVRSDIPELSTRTSCSDASGTGWPKTSGKEPDEKGNSDIRADLVCQKRARQEANNNVPWTIPQSSYFNPEEHYDLRKTCSCLRSFPHRASRAWYCSSVGHTCLVNSSKVAKTFSASISSGRRTVFARTRT